MNSDPGNGAGASSRIPLRVLIVDDSSDEALLLLRELERGGYEPVHERVETPKAMRRALEEGGPWDVILSDHRPSRFSATGLLEVLREADSEAPLVIVVSGVVGEEAAVEAMRAGAHDYVTKDNLSRLCATVGRGLEEARARRKRERAESGLAENEGRFRSLVTNSSDLISIFTPDGTRVYASPSTERLLGYEPEGMVGGNVLDLVHPDDAPRMRGEFAERARTRGTGRPIEFRLRHADGSWRLFESIGTNLLDDPSVGGIVFNARDVTDRKLAEEALKESEERYRRLVELSPDSIMVHDGGKVLFSNAAGAELFGASSPQELVGKTVMDFMHPDYREVVARRIAKMSRRGERAELIEEKVLRLDGRAVDVEGVAMPITYRGEAATLAIARDITERKRAEEELRESQRALSTLMSNLPGMAYRCRNDPGWTMEFVSGGCSELTGYPPEEIIGNRRTSYGDLIHPDDRDAVWEDVQATLAERRPYQLIYRITTASGAVRWVWEQGRGVFSPEGDLLVLEGFVTDASERVGFYRLLEERVTALAGISASLTVGQSMEDILDSVAAKVVQSTPALACSVVLLDPETRLLRTAGSHGLPEAYTDGLEAAYRAGVRSPALEVFRTHRPMLVHDARQVLLDDPLYAPLHPLVHEVRWDVVYFVPLLARGEELGAINFYYAADRGPGEDEKVFLGAVADQTAVAVENAGLFAAAQGKAALEERQRLARELHDSVSQALYGMALGSRTARALLGREAPTECVDEWLEYVLSLAEVGLTEMRALIFELRPESLQTEGLVAALEKQAAATRARHEIPVHTTILCEEPDFPLEVKEALYRIAQEALHNTVKHAHASRAILKLECDATSISLEVSDDGAGFDPEGDFSGHLGLKSMRERAMSLGGTLRMESAPGEGTEIRVRIP